MNNNLEQSYNEADESFDFDKLQNLLEVELQEHFSDLEGLEENFKKIGSPESLGDTIQNVIWDQFINQIGVSAGEDFIKENRGLTLDLRKSAHIQTAENFEKGKIATHNSSINYKDRYNTWQSKFDKDDNGNIKYHYTRAGKPEANIVGGARKIFDKTRPTGSIINKTDMDHTVSAGEIIRDAEANAHLSVGEQVSFANSKSNLYEMDASHNLSKSDTSMTDWLDNPNSKGYKPNEIFDIDEKLEKEYRERDKVARENYEKIKKEGEKKSIETGEQSRKKEAFRIGGTALKAALMGLLAELVKEIIQKLIQWLYAGKKNLTSFFDSLKKAITNFISNLKNKLLTAGNTFLTSVVTAIFGPIIGVIKKAWIFIKQGYQSLKQAINYIKNPENKNKPTSILMLEVGKIIITGLTAGGALILGEVIEKALISLAPPIFGFQIPVLGSLGGILGILFGAISSGIIGAIALNLIDKLIAEKQKRHNIEQQIDTKNKIINIQNQQIVLQTSKLENTKNKFTNNTVERHTSLRDSIQTMNDALNQNSTKPKIDNETDLDNLFNSLDII